MSNETSTGSVSVNRVRTQLTIRIETIEWDTQGCVLRVKGRNITENQYVKVCMKVFLISVRYTIFQLLITPFVSILLNSNFRFHFLPNS